MNINQLKYAREVFSARKKMAFSDSNIFFGKLEIYLNCFWILVKLLIKLEEQTQFKIIRMGL